MYALKALVSLVSGLLIFLVPLLVGGERELSLVAKIGVMLGAVPTLIVCLWGDLYRGPAWISKQWTANWKWIRFVLLAGLAGLVGYLWVFFSTDPPSLPVFYLVCVGYLLFSLVGSAALALLGYLVTQHISRGKGRSMHSGRGDAS